MKEIVKLNKDFFKIKKQKLRDILYKLVKIIASEEIVYNK